MRRSDLRAQMHIISLDLFGLLILTEMRWAEPELCNEYNRIAQLAQEKCFEQLDHMLTESLPIVRQQSITHQKLQNRGLVHACSY